MRNIRDLKYPPDSLRDINAFRNRLAEDLDMKGEDAMVLLGFLLDREYVRISPDTGLFVNPASPEAREYLEEALKTS